MNDQRPPALQDLHAADIGALLPLNNAHAEQTSLLDATALGRLLAMACYARGIDHGTTALLIAFEQTAPYDSPNFLWFKERYASFVYVDRIVVSPAARGRGLARMLYEDLFGWARLAGHERVLCEVNAEPPNPASAAFHRTMGFAAVGTARIADGAKVVRYLERPLVEAPTARAAPPLAGP